MSSTAQKLECELSRVLTFIQLGEVDKAAILMDECQRLLVSPFDAPTVTRLQELQKKCSEALFQLEEAVILELRQHGISRRATTAYIREEQR